MKYILIVGALAVLASFIIPDFVQAYALPDDPGITVATPTPECTNGHSIHCNH